MHSLRIAASIALLATITACGPGENDPGPGGVTVDEAKALDEAAAMLEQEKLPAGAIDNPPQGQQGSPDKQAAKQGE